MVNTSQQVGGALGVLLGLAWGAVFPINKALWTSPFVLLTAGLGLQGLTRLVVRPEVAERITGFVDELDHTIREIRRSIFSLQEPSEGPVSLRGELLRAVQEAASMLGYEPRVSLAGPLDSLVPEETRPDLLATLREALSNAARHADARSVSVEVAVDAQGAEVQLVVRDDGRGMPTEPGRQSGLANLADRAERWGGRFADKLVATNAGLIGISRLSYSLGTNKLIPKQFASLHPRFKTPYISIVVFGVAAAVLVLPGKLTLLAATYSLAATFAFCVAHLAVMRLRYVSPELYRPYQMPINIPFGRASIPVLSVVGALAIGRRISTAGAAQAPRCLYRKPMLVASAQASASRMPKSGVIRNRGLRMSGRPCAASR